MIVDANVVLRAFFPDDEQAQAQTLIHLDWVRWIGGKERLV